MNIIGRKYYFLAFSALLILTALAMIVGFGFKEGIDFSGGTLWQLRAPNLSASSLQAAFQSLNIQNAEIASDAQTGSYEARLPAVAEADHQQYLNTLKTKFPGLEELSFQSVGPSVGADLRNKSILAIVFVLVGISLYTAFAFRKVYRPVSSWKYGWITLFTLFHDVVIPAGLLALLGHLGKAEIDSNFVVALLVVMGFSVHDTIVVFDRIRENLFVDRAKTDFGTVVNDSVNQTLARSVNTSLTLILVLLALYFVGPATLKYFILTLLVGVTTGMYSSIFVASPLLHVWQQMDAKGKR